MTSPIENFISEARPLLSRLSDSAELDFDNTDQEDQIALAFLSRRLRSRQARARTRVLAASRTLDELRSLRGRVAELEHAAEQRQLRSLSVIREVQGSLERAEAHLDDQTRVSAALHARLSSAQRTIGLLRNRLTAVRTAARDGARTFSRTIEQLSRYSP